RRHTRWPRDWSSDVCSSDLLHFAGHKATYDLVPIYERHAGLTELETALNIGATVNGGRNVRELWRFACEGYLGNFVKAEEEKIRSEERRVGKEGRWGGGEGG